MKKKIALGTLGFCGTCGVGYFSLKGEDGKEISKEKQEEKKSLFEDKVLLDVHSNKDSERWEDLSYAYSRAEGDILISSIKKDSPKSEIASQLQAWCKEKLESEVPKEDYEKAKRWCTVPNNIKEKLKEEGYISLPSYNNADDESLQRWNEIFNKYTEAFNVDKPEDVIGVGDYNKDNIVNSDDRRQFTEKCQEQLTYDMPADIQDKTFISSKKWCMWKA